MKKSKILVVEDDHDILDLIKLQLEVQGHEVDCFLDGGEALQAIDSNEYKMYILDWMLPGTSGLELCRAVRAKEHGKDKPVLMVTALTESKDIIRGLDSGADDYLKKPFDIGEFQARVRALLRRSEAQKNEVDSSAYIHEDLSIDLKKVKATYQDQEIQLTQSEFTILSVLMKNKGTVFTRKQLYNSTQGPNTFATSRTIDTHVAGLRKKLGDAAKYIETIRGVGYRLVEA